MNFITPLTGQVGDVAVIDFFDGRDWGTGTNYSAGQGSFSAVPIPAAAWLFGSALAGLGWLRRKQAA
ncbi:MAG: VPLPA-CTERM sorting domain-containing protein [Gammaproteobacteria bacterium]